MSDRFAATTTSNTIPTCAAHHIPLTGYRDPTSGATWWACSMCSAGMAPSPLLPSLVPARLPASEPPACARCGKVQTEHYGGKYCYPFEGSTEETALVEFRHPLVAEVESVGGFRESGLLAVGQALLDGAATLAALRAEVEREQAKTRAMWEEREGWKRTASERGFTNIALRRLAQAVCDRLPEGMDAAVDQLRAALSAPPAEGPGR